MPNYPPCVLAPLAGVEMLARFFELSRIVFFLAGVLFIIGAVVLYFTRGKKAPPQSDPNSAND